MSISPVRTPATTPPAAETAAGNISKTASEAKLRQAKAALGVLKQSGLGGGEERKAIARKKVAQLKERLKLLQAMTSLSTKGAARLAAQLARELGAAVKAYAGAVGASNTPDGAHFTNPVAAFASAAEAFEVDGVPAASPEEAIGSERDPALDERGIDSDWPRGSAEMFKNPYQAALDEAKLQSQQNGRAGHAKGEDADFLSEVRLLARQIKSLVKRPGGQGTASNAPSPAESREAHGAFAATDGIIDEASRGLTGSVVFLLV